MSIFSENLKYYRKKVGLTQKELGEKSNIVQSSIAKYEQGNEHPKRATMQALGEALGIPYQVLVVERRKATTYDEILNVDNSQEYEDYIEHLYQKQLDYENSSEFIAFSEYKDEVISNFYFQLLDCKDFLSRKQFNEMLVDINSIFDNFDKKDPVEHTVSRLSKLFSVLDAEHFNKIIKIPERTLEKYDLRNEISWDD